MVKMNIASREFELSAGVTARAVEEKELSVVIRNLWPEVFSANEDIEFFQIPKERFKSLKPLLAEFAKTHTEKWVFYAGKSPIGWSIGEMDDESTFYMRNSGLLPEYRRKGIYSSFLERFITELTALGYERVTSHHQMNNNPVIIAKLKAGFRIIGTEMDERYGAQIKLVKFLHEDRARAARRLFSLGNN